MPEIPRRRDGKRGRIAKSDAHKLHEALLILEECVLCFMSDPDVSFTNNTGEQKIRLSKVKGQNQSLGVLPDRTLRTCVVLNSELSRFHGSTRIQSTHRHSDRACLKCR